MPGLTEEIEVAVKKQGMFSDDYLVYHRGHGTECDDSTRYLFFNKTGSWRSGDCVIDLENYIREDGDTPPRGR